ncbi:hypothetical protein [Bradyrhizobium acaciae]|uniref:hypothetical protein n=1 Tax=Bradyrhizobium acaciae TaxID=2683706 RepID=UPI001E43B3CC|nr:hypothetical protein [Bradyrhizobium acaciae]MCC8983798.1 hypothetical protein [Bradyrhizobium acaciae]
MSSFAVLIGDISYGANLGNPYGAARNAVARPALACGLILSIGSMVSRHLPPRFIAVSSGIAVQAIMNVPLTTGLLSNGVALLFLLWWLTPEQQAAASRHRRQSTLPINAVGVAA